MRTHTLAATVVLSAALAVAGISVRASGDPFDAYCIIQKVVVGQDEGERSAVQIWGTCSVITPGVMTADGQYFPGSIEPPHRGYLYYFATKVNEVVAQKEWADLKAIAGTGEVVGIGKQGTSGRVRWPDEKPQSPNEYTTQMGLWKVTTNPAYAKLVADLKKAADGK